MGEGSCILRFKASGGDPETFYHPLELLLHLGVVFLLGLGRAGVEQVVLDGHLRHEVLEASRRLHEVVL